MVNDNYKEGAMNAQTVTMTTTTGKTLFSGPLNELSRMGKKILKEHEGETLTRKKVFPTGLYKGLWREDEFVGEIFSLGEGEKFSIKVQ